MQKNIKDIIESLLFVAQEPLTIDKIKSVLETVETRQIRSALDTLADQYVARGGGFFLCEVAGGWQLRSRPEYNEWIKRMLQPSPQRLTRAALETLAIVAYNQPIIRADIEHIRGVDCGGVLRQLMERKLIRVLGRKEIPGRPIIYATTKLFLELFNLKSLKDLPSPKEMEELGAAEEASHRQPGTDDSKNTAESGGQNQPDMPFPPAGVPKMARLSGFNANALSHAAHGGLFSTPETDAVSLRSNQLRANRAAIPKTAFKISAAPHAVTGRYSIAPLPDTRSPSAGAPDKPRIKSAIAKLRLKNT